MDSTASLIQQYGLPVIGLIVVCGVLAVVVKHIYKLYNDIIIEKNHTIENLTKTNLEYLEKIERLLNEKSNLEYRIGQMEGRIQALEVEIKAMERTRKNG